jgi:hypothetical protein
MTRTPVNADPTTASLYYGAPAVAYTLHAAGQPAYRTALAVLDRSIDTIVRHRLATAHRRIDHGLIAQAREYDLIHGLTGLGAYLMHRYHRCRPSPCAGLSPARSTTAAPPRPARSAVGAPIPASEPDARRREPRPGGSRVHCDSLGEAGARLCPSGLATSAPQAFNVASKAGDNIPPRSSRRNGKQQDAPRPAHIRQV